MTNPPVISNELVRLLASRQSIKSYLEGVRSGVIDDNYTNILAGIMKYANKVEDMRENSVIVNNLRLLSQSNGIGALPIDWSALLTHMNPLLYFTGVLKGESYLQFIDVYDTSVLMYTAASPDNQKIKSFKGERTMLMYLNEFFEDFDINIRDERGITLLMKAAYSSNYPALIRHAIDLGADPMMVSPKNGSVLHFIFSERNVYTFDKFQRMMKYGVDECLNMEFIPYFVQYTSRPLDDTKYPNIKTYLNSLLKDWGKYMLESEKFAIEKMLKVIEHFDLHKNAMNAVSVESHRKTKAGI